MKLSELYLGIFVTLCAIAILVSSRQFSPIPGQDYGAGTMPTAIGLVTLGLGIFLMVQGGMRWRKKPGVRLAGWARSGRSLVGFVVTLALIGGYIALSGSLGFIPSAILVMAVLMITLRVRIDLAIGVSIIAAVVIQQSFGRLLLVPLPRTEFLSFLW